MIPVSIIKRKLIRDAPGTIRLHTDDVIPLGWFLCDGSYVYQAQCVRLFAVCGTKYGSAPAGMFKLPDMRGRTAIGAIDDDVGELSGEETHTLSEAEIEAHQHTMKVQATAGSEQLPGSHYIAASIPDRSSGMPFNKVFSNSADGTLHVDTITTTGSAEVNAFSLIQPSVGVNFIIKA